MSTAITTASKTATSIVVSENGGQGLPGDDGLDGAGFNQVRKSKLDNPLCHLFKTNKLDGTISGAVTWTRSTTATFVDRYGVVQTAGINTPREEKEGFLIEGASTNLALHSEDFSNATWLKLLIGGASIPVVTADFGTAPDGTATADRVIFDRGVTSTGSDISQIRQNITFSGLSTYTIWIKSNSGIDITMEMSIPNGAAVINVTAKWQRFVVMGDFTGASNASISLIGDTSLAQAADLLMWGAQVETLPFASSYMPTTVSSVTRTQDLVSADINNNLPNVLGAYSLSLNILPKIKDSVSVVLGFENLGFENYSINSSGTFVLRDTTTDRQISSAGALITSSPVNLTVALDGTNAQCYIDGFINGPLTPYAYSNIDFNGILYFGTLSGGSPMYAHLKDLRLYDFKLNVDETMYLSGV